MNKDPNALGLADTNQCVTFLGKHGGGTAAEIAGGFTYLTPGVHYIVEEVDIGDWRSSYKLVGIDRRFNTVMFDRFPKEKPVEVTRPEYTVGLLGVSIPQDLVASNSFIAELRLTEIEKRILAIEALMKRQA